MKGDVLSGLQQYLVTGFGFAMAKGAAVTAQVLAGIYIAVDDWGDICQDCSSCSNRDGPKGQVYRRRCH